ncbi:metallophosphoesterase [Candidatus Latescibacterota bacterium]
MTVVIGDVHGCAAELEELLSRTGVAASRDRLLLTGDAFSRGPEPVRVWELIGTLGAGMVLGNHDGRLLSQLHQHETGSPVSFRRPHHRVTFEALLPRADQILPWLGGCPLHIQSTDGAGRPYLLIHAGINPEKGLGGTSRDEFLTIRTWPPTGGLDGPRWYDHLEPSAGQTIFGHDAPLGLVTRHRVGDEGGRPWLLGLDSGCVYGGSLSAYVVEEDRLVQVPSRQPAL